MRKEVWFVCSITLCTFLIVTADRGNLTCTSPPKIEGSIPPRVEGNEHAIGTSFTYSCNYGYVSRNSVNHISTCVVNKMTGQAEWTVPEIACIPRSCGDPGYVNNGRRVGNLFTFPNKVVFQCDEGHKLKGINERYCQAGGEWSGRLPACELIYCSAPPDPVNGRVRYSSLEYGTELRYECNVGFQLKEHEPRFCTEDGTWSDVEPDCIEIRCENPIPPEHGRVQLSGDPKVGSIATFSCNPDKKLYGAATTKCLMTGLWTFDSPKCLSICMVPYIENGQMGQIYMRQISRWRHVEDFQTFPVGNQVDHGETLHLRCDEYFLPAEGDTTFEDNHVGVTCNDGTWSKDLHCKQRIRCEKPIHPQHGRVELSGQPIVGSIAKFSCYRGRKLYGASTVECLSTGQWTNDSPKCLSICSVPYIANGEIGQFYSRQISKQQKEEGFTKFNLREQVDHNKTLFLRCKEYFLPAEGDTIFEDNLVEVTCNDGTWSKDLQCRTTSCLKEPPKTKNGEAMISGRKHGNTIWYRCNNSKDKKVTGNVTCHYGSWIGNTPKCLNSPCNTKDLNYPGLVKPSEKLLATSETLDIVCKEGFILSTSARNITCSGGKWNITQDPCTKVQNAPCNTKDLNYPGLVKPSQELLATSETLDIVCKEGFRLSTSARNITCSGGKWNITQDPCTKVQNDIEPNVTTSEDSSSTRLHKKEVSESSHNNITISKPTEECYCIYGGSGYFVEAKVGDKYLEVGDRVRRGETVSFECQGLKILSWQNSFRIYVKVNVTCTTCQTWERSDNPICSAAQTGSPHIILDDALHILPGGAAEIQFGKPVLITCSSTFTFPQWYLRGTLAANQDTYYEDRGSTRLHYTRMYIAHSGYENTGIYECLVHGNSPLVDSRTVLDLRVKGNTCPSFVTDLHVSYTNGNEVDSWATFSCPHNTILVGESQSRCQNDGTWSSPQPYCKNNPICSILPRVTGLETRYSDGINVGSNVSFRCASPKVLNGNSYAICQDDGIWSHPLPTCEDKCSIEDLSLSLPENVVPDMSNVNEEYLPFGSAMQLTCEDKFIPDGNSTVLCGKRGKWKLGNFNCVSGCLLNINPSSHLNVRPIKEFYRFGEHVILSCPLGEKITSDVERVMCMGFLKWSDSIPECKES